MGKPANHRHRKLDGLPKDSVKSRELISTNSLLQLHTKTQSVNHLDLECDQVDIKAAFLNGDLEETVYLAPEGSNISADKVLHLRKSLHGLKQSPRCFKNAFDEWLRGQVQLEPIPIPDDKAIHS